MNILLRTLKIYRVTGCVTFPNHICGEEGALAGSCSVYVSELTVEKHCNLSMTLCGLPSILGEPPITRIPSTNFFLALRRWSWAVLRIDFRPSTVAILRDIGHELVLSSLR
jgi:hypothetical protein